MILELDLQTPQVLAPGAPPLLSMRLQNEVCAGEKSKRYPGPVVMISFTYPVFAATAAIFLPRARERPSHASSMLPCRTPLR